MAKDVAAILHATALMKTLTIDDNGVKLTPGVIVKRNKRKYRILPDSSDTNSPPVSELQSNVSSSSVQQEVCTGMPPKRTSKTKPNGGAGASSAVTPSATLPVDERVLMLHVTAFEKKMEVLPVVDVETVRLVLLEHAGKTYYHDPNKHKLYTRTGAKSVGAYVGRWDPRRECICTEVHDSDADN